MQQFVRLTVMIAMISACASGTKSASSVSPAVDPVGVYEYSSTANGQPISGTITISGSSGVYSGLMTTGVSRDLAFSSVRVSGNRVHMEGPGAAYSLDFVLDGSALTGKWAMGALGGDLRGKRRGSSPD